ncbi:hypothetical protein LH51_15480 [Nitrincola sp. A-D6]|uniref:DUF4238 domain-containing protein n=1 Tax=Nitrincola sp. A-D6 TaxID=1545442 RepID=UPI00051FC192|nr:DUF4238 domain-containing protein [Nitrincola sp. A-D6]KGK41365.1 hypothetical protein LH51_15480 [Nitrincola sp. A-D6]
MTARHHHYLSQCYLKGFTRGRAKKSKLTVFDLKQKKSFETTPRNVGGMRDFNRVDIDGIDQNHLESALAEFEGQAASVLKKLGEDLEFTGETKDILLNLIALIAVRSPERREHMRKFQAQLADRVMGLTLESKDRWESQVANLKKDDPGYQNEVTYEEAKAFFDSKEYTIEVAREHHIHMEMVQIEAILPCLFDRNWVLVKSSSETGPFITCDNPVSLSWIDPDSVPPFYRSSPGFGLKGTQVYFPISQDIALMGEFEQSDGVIEGTEELVALCNSTMLHNFHKQIYAPKSTFKFYGKEGLILNGNRILKEINA